MWFSEKKTFENVRLVTGRVYQTNLAMGVAAINDSYQFNFVRFIKIHRIYSNVASNWAFLDCLVPGYRSYGASNPGTNVDFPLESINASGVAAALDINATPLAYFSLPLDNYFYKPMITKSFRIQHQTTGLRQHTLFWEFLDGDS